MPHRLHNHIQVLIDQVVATRDPLELDHLIRGLRAALHEHSLRLRRLAADQLATNTSPRALATTEKGEPLE